VVSVTPRTRISPGEMTPVTHWTGGWVDPRAGLDTEAKGEILSLLGIEAPSWNKTTNIRVNKTYVNILLDNRVQRDHR